MVSLVTPDTWVPKDGSDRDDPPPAEDLIDVVTMRRRSVPSAYEQMVFM